MMTAEGILRLLEVAQACRYDPAPNPAPSGRHSRATNLPKDPTGETVADNLRWRVSDAYSRLLRLVHAGIPIHDVTLQSVAAELNLAVTEWEGQLDHSRREVRRADALPS